MLPAVKQRFIHFNQLGLKDNVAQLIAFQRRSGGGSSSSGPAGTGSASGSAASSRASSEEGSAGSLAGQKRRSGAEEVAPRRRHVRFDSSDDEGTSGGGGGGDGADAAAAALQAVAIEDAVAGMDRGSLRSSPSAARVEDATEPVAAAEAEAAGAPRLPALVVSNIHVLFNPRRGDLKMGQVGGGSLALGFGGLGGQMAQVGVGQHEACLHCCGAEGKLGRGLGSWPIPPLIPPTTVP